MKNDAMKNAPAGENERPLMLAPAFKDYIWGGERLKRDWGKRTDLSPLAESWELSCHEAGPSVVASGEWAGRTLAQVLAAHPQFVGTKAEKAGEFPLLIKLIDAAGPLSVQVHPDDDYAEPGGARAGQNRDVVCAGRRRGRGHLLRLQARNHA